MNRHIRRASFLTHLCKFLVIAILVLKDCLVPQRSLGAPIAYDGFNYSPPGANLNGQNGGTGFTGNWSGSTMFTIAAGSLSDPVAFVPTSGNSVSAPSSDGNKDMERTLATVLGTPGTTAYFSFLLQPQGTVGAGFDSGHFGLVLDNGSVNSNSLYIGKPGTGAPNPNLYDLENVGGAGRVATSVAAVSNTTVFMVLRADFTAGNDTFRLYINPPTSAEPLIANATKSDLNIGTISSVDITGPGAFAFDELQVGTSYFDVVPEPATVILFALGGIGLLVGRRLNKK